MQETIYSKRAGTRRSVAISTAETANRGGGHHEGGVRFTIGEPPLPRPAGRLDKTLYELDCQRGSKAARFAHISRQNYCILSRVSQSKCRFRGLVVGRARKLCLAEHAAVIHIALPGRWMPLFLDGSPRPLFLACGIALQRAMHPCLAVSFLPSIASMCG